MTALGPDRHAPPSVRGIAMTDLSAAVGGVVWIALLVGPGLSDVERALALAMLVLVPLGLGLIATPSVTGRASAPFAAAVVLQPIAAVAAAASLVVGRPLAAALAMPWLVVVGLLAATGLLRVLDRGLVPVSETVLDAGLGYTTVGALALVLSHLEITLWFSPVIVFLTAVHFHYAGLVVPVVAGLTGRCDGVESDPTFRALAAVVTVGPALIGIGIAFSAIVEIVAVAGYTVGVAALGGYLVVRVAPDRPRAQGAALVVAALVLPVSMALALGFVLAVYAGIDPLGLSIPRMVSLHGNLNAVGFALVAMVGWRLAPPAATGTRSWPSP